MKKFPQWWCPDLADTVTMFSERFPEKADELHRAAKQVCRNVFLFSGDWELESTARPAAFPEWVDWEAIPDGDPEFAFALNRHTFLQELAIVYRQTGEKMYARNAVRLLSDWLERVPLTSKTQKTAWRQLEAGMRCENWLRGLALLEDTPFLTDELRSAAEESLHVHGQYLADAGGPDKLLSNWGIIQDHGLFLLGLWFENTAWTSLAAERLALELRVQVMPDGVHWEQSPMYQFEVLRCCLDVLLTARRAGQALPPEIAESVRRMARTLAVWCKPGGRIPMQSDSDEVDVRGLLQLAAVFFQDGSLKGMLTGEADWNFLWFAGAGAVLEYEALETIPQTGGSAAFSASGNYILREGFAADGPYLHLHSGSTGSGHGHADQLHIDLAAHGEDVLVDAGRFTYRDGAIRRALKSPSAHNTVCVDGKESGVPDGSWSYSALAAPCKGEFYDSTRYGYVSGGHLGYLTLPDGGIFVSRRVIWFKPDLYLLCDTFYGAGTHLFEQFFHFSERGSLKLQKDGALFQGDRAWARLLALSESAGLSIRDSMLARRYNHSAANSCLVARCPGKGGSSLFTVLRTAPAGTMPEVEARLIPVYPVGGGEAFPAHTAQAVELCADGRSVTILIRHQEAGAEDSMMRAGNYCGYGQVVLFTPEDPAGEVLQW